MYGRAYGKARYGGGVGYLLPGVVEASQRALQHAGISPVTTEAVQFRSAFVVEYEKIAQKWRYG